MPLLVTYRGRPLKRRRRFEKGLLLYFYSRQKGEAGEQLIVSNDDWLRFGKEQFFPAGEMPDVRVLSDAGTDAGNTGWLVGGGQELNHYGGQN